MKEMVRDLWSVVYVYDSTGYSIYSLTYSTQVHALKILVQRRNQSEFSTKYWNLYGVKRSSNYKQYMPWNGGKLHSPTITDKWVITSHFPTERSIQFQFIVANKAICIKATRTCYMCNVHTNYTYIHTFIYSIRIHSSIHKAMRLKYYNKFIDLRLSSISVID